MNSFENKYSKEEKEKMEHIRKRVKALIDATRTTPDSIYFVASEATPKDVSICLEKMGYKEVDREMCPAELTYLIYFERNAKNKTGYLSDRICVNGNAETYKLYVSVFE